MLLTVRFFRELHFKICKTVLGNKKNSIEAINGNYESNNLYQIRKQTSDMGGLYSKQIIPPLLVENQPVCPFDMAIQLINQIFKVQSLYFYIFHKGIFSCSRHF